MLSASAPGSDLDLFQLYDGLQELINKHNIDGEWTKNACATTGAILRILPKSSFEKRMPLLELFAKLVAMGPSESGLGIDFAHLFLLHLYHPKLYAQLRADLAGSHDEAPFKIPDWWPELCYAQDLDKFSSPLEFAFDLRGFVASHSQEIYPILRILVDFLAQLDVLNKESHPPWNCFASLISIMSKSIAHRDLATMILCHEVDVIDVLHRLSVSTPSPSGQRYAKFLQETLLIRPSILTSFSDIHGLPGAARLLQLYSQNQYGAYEVAVKTPFRFVIDLLNHASGTSWFRNPTVLTCISVCSYRLEDWATSADEMAIYDEFNKVSNVNSLLIVTTQFGCIIAQCLLESYGDNTCSPRFLRSLNVFAQSALPPLSKPNYFFSEPKSAPSNETLAMLMKLDEFDELHRSLLRVIKFLRRILTRGISDTATMVPNEALAEKIHVRRIQPICSLILLVLKCNEMLDPSRLTSKFTGRLVYELAGDLIQGPYSSLAWTTLFNCAIETSYNEIGISRIWLEFLRTFCSQSNDDGHKELIADGINRFAGLFHPEQKSATSFGSSYMAAPSAVLAKSEYMYLYQFARNKVDLDETVQSKMANHYGMGGRQQSVHVDKFGKDRA